MKGKTFKDEQNKTIQLLNSTKKQLEKLGNMRSCYDDVISDLIQHCNTCDRFWVDRE